MAETGWTRALRWFDHRRSLGGSFEEAAGAAEMALAIYCKEGLDVGASEIAAAINLYQRLKATGHSDEGAGRVVMAKYGKPEPEPDPRICTEPARPLRREQGWTASAARREARRTVLQNLITAAWEDTQSRGTAEKMFLRVVGEALLMISAQIGSRWTGVDSSGIIGAEGGVDEA